MYASSGPPLHPLGIADACPSASLVHTIAGAGADDSTLNPYSPDDSTSASGFYLFDPLLRMRLVQERPGMEPSHPLFALRA